jgi:hypothetical protein
MKNPTAHKIATTEESPKPSLDKQKEVAFYYPGPVWNAGEWVKNLILFFDGIALLVPEYMTGKPFTADPAIAEGLQREGLLHILEPEKLVDKAATKKLATALTEVIRSGAFDGLAKESVAFHTLSHSRLGYYGDPKLADAVFKELKARKLAKDTEDGVSIPMHPLVRGLVLVLLAQILRPCGTPLGLELSPATDRVALVEALENLLSIPAAPSTGRVVSLDLETVGVDLGPIPIDEVLGFRRENLKQHRKYARAVRSFVDELSLLPSAKREDVLGRRREEIRDLAEDLKLLSRRQWKRPAYFALTALGAVWSAKSGNPLGVLLGAGAALLSPPSSQDQAGAYSYLFRAAERFA